MSNQKISNQGFIKLISNPKKTLTEISGRYKEEAGVERKIILDIIKKLKLNKKDSFLDIGCGHGLLTDLIIKFCKKNKIKLSMCDIKIIIQKLKKKYFKYKNIKFIESEFQKRNFKKKRYDKILIYSVIHYADEPKLFLNKAYKLLKTRGRLMIGDIPNINKKFRFLNTNSGKRFELKGNRNINNLNKLTSSLKSFLKHTKQNKKINDTFIFWILKNFQKLGANVYLAEQSNDLPYSFTRVDIIIEKLK